MLRKRAILKLLETLPEEIDSEELFYRLYVMQKIEAGEASLAAGDLISQEDLEREADSWRG